MSGVQNRTTSTRLAAILLILAPSFYFAAEYYVSMGYTPTYSYWVNYTSELGVPLPFISPDTGLLNHSVRASNMNLAFATHGLLYLAGQLCLLRATAHNTDQKLQRRRKIASFAYCFGMCLLAVVPGGPLCEKDGTWPLHLLGAFTAIISGNLVPILAGMATSRLLYKAFSIAMGTMGLLGLIMFAKADFIDKDNTIRGFWQRSSFYATHLWDYVTAFMLVVELLRPALSSVKQQ